ncbi:MAG: ABC transporter substrate-binding protein [Acholeplasmataceae bacterium]|nr:ABC transporter substrate-binding protein [Acholeplasmataceae bacterium]
MKKMSVLALIITCLFLFSACNQDDQNTDTKPIPTKKDEQTLVVGVSEIGGFFGGEFRDFYSSTVNKEDAMIRELINGYETYTIDKNGKIVLNETVVKNVVTTLNNVTGDKTYQFEIHSDLYWSNEVKITAKDYVFSILMQASSEWRDLQSVSKIGQWLVGYTEYRKESVSEEVKFKGLHLLDTLIFSVTIDSKYASQFYETQYISLRPMPFHRLTPLNTNIYSDLDGSWIEEGGFSLLKDAKSPSGYVNIPDVTCGPYLFVSYLNQKLVLKINRLFKGNFEGKKPVIDNIIIKRVKQQEYVNLVVSGEIDLVTGIEGDYQIQKVKDEPNISFNSHFPDKYVIMAFMADFGPTKNYLVRQAIAYLVDKEMLMDYYGVINREKVHSDYGVNQWMYVESKEWIDSYMNPYDYSINSSNGVLDKTEWIYEIDGVTLFDSSKAIIDSGYYRHNESGEVLEIIQLVTGSNPNVNHLNNVSQFVGIKSSHSYGQPSSVWQHYNYSYDLDPKDRKYHIFYLPNEFTIAYNPYPKWHSDFLGTWYNASQLEDSIINPAAPVFGDEKTLDELTKMINEVTPGDHETYLSLWREYQLRFNELSPYVTLFSTQFQYFNVFDSKIKGLETTSYWNWAQSICDIYFDE